ncbi:MAG: DEAD/DEAH box helicase family protein, partial [Thermoflexales bacterium]|nr:DEAD/DEAH box helicase family protein [Thermoflexales bacterium]
GASDVTRRLFAYWFEEEHEVPGFGAPFRYHFCQREAIETLAWLVEIAKQRDAQTLIREYATVSKKDLWSDNLVFQTTMDGRRQLRRYVPELDREGVQELPPQNLRRFAFKLATGSGKTWVMAMAIVWARFHKQFVEGSDLSTNFLIVAPNVIVYQRLERDFAANRIFHELPLIPPEWRGSFSQKVILRGETTEPDPSGNLFLTNIQQLYESREEEWTPANAIEALLGPSPPKDLAKASRRSILDQVKSLKDLVVLNDEAHHVHDSDLAWSQSLLAIHEALPQGLALWLDFSATPKDQNGMYFPWTVCDYPLAQAVEDRIVKAPLIVTKEDDPKQPKDEPGGVTKDNIGEKYGYWLQAAVARWKEHDKVYRQLGARPVLFIMAEKNAYADAIGKYLRETKEFGFAEDEVLVIHTDAAGEITRGDLERARAAARDIDNAESRIKAIVSVMMLREGWDVRNVTVVLGLRPFTAKAEILPEQVIGRGLRLMTQISPDRTQTLEVLGTRNLLKVLKDQLEAEGVGVASAKADPPPPVIVAPVQERLQYDITVPITKPSLVHDVRKLADLSVAELEAIYDREELAEPFRIRLRLEFATTETEVHQADLAVERLPMAQELMAGITKQVIEMARLPNRFAEVFPLVRHYVASRCFGRAVNLDDETLRTHLARLELQEGIARYLARRIANLTVERRTIEFDRADFRLSETKPFSWRRNLPPLVATKTVFNYVATYNDFERRFAQFLDRADDVVRFASLGTTEQGDSGVQFRVDYLKPSGAVGFYYPDWVVVQQTPSEMVNWIIETKGRVWEGTAAKDEAITYWCDQVSRATDCRWQYARVNQQQFDRFTGRTLAELLSLASAPSVTATPD